MIYAFGTYEIDDELYELRRDEVPVPIQRKTFDLLAYLARSGGAVIPREQLLRDVWPDVVVSEPALTQALSTVRKAIGDDRADPRIIKTVRGRGYRFAAEVTKRGLARSERTSEKPRAAPLVGRDDALRHLERALADARSGKGRLVILVGEQGIGKTRLVEALEARADGVPFVKGFAFAGVGAPPLWPWVQVDRRLGGPTALADLDDAQVRFRFGDEVVRRILDAASKAPLVVVLEDAHWADEATLGVVSLLAPELARANVLLVVTSRSASTGPLPSLARMPIASVLELDRLRRDDVATLLAAVTGEARGDAVVDRVLEKTGGLPWLVVQISRVLGHDVALGAPGTSVMLHTGAVREAIAQQVAGLSEPVRRALTVAAVMGTSFALGPLVLALEAAPEHVLGLLDLAASEKVIARAARTTSEANTYRFTQPLLRDALYRKLPDGERTTLHARVGRALREHWATDAERHAQAIAPHLLEAAPLGDAAEAIRWALLAFEGAVAEGNQSAAEKLVLQARTALESVRPGPDADALRAGIERAHDLLRIR